MNPHDIHAYNVAVCQTEFHNEPGKPPCRCKACEDSRAIVREFDGLTDEGDGKRESARG